jgi:translation elongation factor EF-Tu-like GTPase
MKLGIQGIQEAQRANMRHIASLRPTGALGVAIQEGTLAAHRYTVAITHVDTGALRASERVELEGLRGTVFVDPSTTNPRSGARPADYVMFEHARGGSHASFLRTYSEQASQIGNTMIDIYTRGLAR